METPLNHQSRSRSPKDNLDAFECRTYAGRPAGGMSWKMSYRHISVCEPEQRSRNAFDRTAFFGMSAPTTRDQTPVCMSTTWVFNILSPNLANAHPTAQITGCCYDPICGRWGAARQQCEQLQESWMPGLGELCGAQLPNFRVRQC